MKISRTIELTQRPEKVGRNDPCPCGSGKKYKKCHLLQELPEPMASPDKSGWISRLLDWAILQSWYFPNFEKLFKKLLGAGKRQINEDELKFISETLLFEVKVKNGKTPLELFVEETRSDRSKLEVYREWTEKNKFGAWEILEVFLGKGCRIREFGKDDEYLASEHLGSYAMQAGDVIIARLLPFSNGWMFGGGVMIKLPAAWIYELKKNRINFSITAEEFLGLWFNKKDKNEQERNYDQLKNDLESFVIAHELPFNIENFDQRFKETENPVVFFYPLYKSLYGFPELMDEAVKIVSALWNEVHTKQELAEQIGSIEKALAIDFSEYCGKRFRKEEIIDPQLQRELSKKWREQWLGTFQEALGTTPQDAIEKERQELGNTRTSFDYESTVVFWPKRWDEASILHEKGLKKFRENKFYEARRFFEQIYTQYKDFPHLYRTIANLAMSEGVLGDKQKAISYLQEAIKINTRYSFAKERLEALKKMSDTKIRETAEAFRLKSAFELLTRKIKKAQGRRNKNKKRFGKY